MISWSLATACLAIIIISLPIAQSQFVTSLPKCIQTCIKQSQDDNCKVTDIACLCRASAGNFLPDLITCMHGQCDNDLDNDILLTPLQLACQLAGAPIPESAIRNAENEASSLATQITTTITLVPITLGGSSTSEDVGFTTTISQPVSVSVSMATVTTTQSGSTITVIFPVTTQKTTTVPGPASTTTSTSISSPSSIYYSQPSSDSSTTTITTSVAAAKTSSSSSNPSKISTLTSGDESNSSPFKDTNNSASRGKVGRWFGVSVLAALGYVVI